MRLPPHKQLLASRLAYGEGARNQRESRIRITFPCSNDADQTTAVRL